MASKIQGQITGFLFVTFVLWYLLRRTALGSAYSADMLTIPQSISEGLHSAGKYYMK